MAVYTKTEAGLMAKNYIETGDLLHIYFIINKNRTMDVHQFSEEGVALTYLNSYFANQNISDVLPLRDSIETASLENLTQDLLEDYFYRSVNKVIKNYLVTKNLNEDGTSTLTPTESYAVPVTYKVKGVVYVSAVDEGDLRAMLVDSQLLEDSYIPEEFKHIKGTVEIDWDGLESVISRKNKRLKQ